MDFMAEYGEQIRGSRLFAGLTEAERSDILRCIAPARRSYKKGSVILTGGESGEFGMVLSGTVVAERADYSGGRSVAGAVLAGGVFGELLAAFRGRVPVTVYAAEQTDALIFSLDRALSGCAMACAGHGKLVKNLFSIAGEQYFSQSDRLYYLSRKTLRDKLLAYLGDCAGHAGRDIFMIPYSREELASYLGAERSALSRELSRMRESGLLEYEGRSFKLLCRDGDSGER